MKRSSFLLALVIILIVSCTKTKTSVNNNLTPSNNQEPAFSVNGITDITLTNVFSVSATLYLSINYLDSAQETITLSISGLPNGTVIDTSWINSGIPSFNTSLTVYDTTAIGATPGTYPITLTATTTSGKKKNYSFNLRILPMPTTFLGKYDSCYLYCGPTVLYMDSVYADVTVVNKIWFVNYANSGQHIYGLISLGGGLTIPAQTIGGNTYTGSGNLSAAHAIIISISGSCAINMFNQP